MAAGYSGTPLARKLGIKAGARVLVQDAPRSYRELIAPMPDGVDLDAPVSQASIIHMFVTQRTVLARHLQQARKKMLPDAAVWVSWPKRTSKVDTDITEDMIREICLPLGLVDIKVCAVDEIWSGLKLVIRKELRSAGSTPAAPRRATNKK